MVRENVYKIVLNLVMLIIWQEDVLSFAQMLHKKLIEIQQPRNV